LRNWVRTSLRSSECSRVRQRIEHRSLLRRRMLT
jgi:hypothetical protein